MKRFLIVVLVSTIFLISFSSLTAKPIAPNPEYYWPGGTEWGSKLRLENGTWVGEAWFGAAGEQHSIPFLPPPGFVYDVWVEDGSEYLEIVRGSVSSPQSYSWDLKMYHAGPAPGAGTLSWVLENSTHAFVPSDFSLVLENSSTFGSVNLRAVDNVWVSFPSRASFYADNAVNVSVSPDSQSVIRGGDLSYDVTVSNTGRYDDVYDLSADNENGWSVDVSPSVLSVPAGGDNSATLTVTTQAGMDEVTVLADGDYADDEVSCTVEMGSLGGVEVSIMPEESGTMPGNSLEYTVLIKNLGENLASYSLTSYSNLNWSLKFADNLIEVPAGEKRQTTLSVVTSETNPSYGEDNIVVTATSLENAELNDSDTCIARFLTGGVSADLITKQKSGDPGDNLLYQAKIKNTGEAEAAFNLTARSEIDNWPSSVSSKTLTLDPGASSTVTLSVSIPLSAEPGVYSVASLEVTSRDDSSVSDSVVCMVRVEKTDRNEGEHSTVYIGVIVVITVALILTIIRLKRKRIS